MKIRINKENNVTIETIITSEKELNEIITLCQVKRWTYDIVGRRPW